MAESKKILVVEDDQDILELYEYIYSYEGYEVMGSATGIDLSALIDTFRPGLVILDVDLGELNGAELCRAIKTDPATSQIVVFLVSANLHSAQLKYHSGADGLIAKPFDLDDLLKRTTAVFSGSSASNG